ncbi:hypothetical protein A2164_04050 [Candidatus Curtissbacteria bacterium RBG_13_35_7]|uniref:YknX-like C-terminal permuted SH3-like domain-containing protein n=1 Tax=Candidatus Curtissbacteria bacterium RBG_13_35_7 TaxID=1797705 RepID=A0A1F5G630_9BACT|nr:MAG: hypothetical protein A2164_04050 [Candidatus Curtissbacteria bacterium RBG_13_35_7]
MKKLTTRVNFSRIFGKIKKTAYRKSAPIKVKTRKITKSISRFIQIRPLTSFFIILIILFILIVAGNFLTKPPETPQIAHKPIPVEIFSIGSVPKVTMQAQIEKAGVVQIVAQAPGIVSNINVVEGQKVTRGKTLVALASNYLGGNAASIQRQLAQKQYQFTKDNYDLQKDLIAKQKEVAQKTDSNADELRSITDKSLDDTRSLVSLNDDILSTLDTNLANLESTNVGGANDSLILQTKQLKSQFQSANNQVKSGLRSAEYAADDDNNPATLSNLGREIAEKQLELQQKSLDLNRETNLLQLRLAQVGESSMYPASPFQAVVEKVHVRRNQSVNPGTPLVTLVGSDQTLTATALVDSSTAQKVSILEPSIININGEKLEITLTHIATEATNGQLYAVTYSLPDKYAEKLTDKSYVTIEIPLGYPDSPASIPFIPIDAVFQTQEESIVYLLKDDKAVSTKISLGSVIGAFVEITSGINQGDQIILNRNIIDGDKVTISN